MNPHPAARLATRFNPLRHLAGTTLLLALAAAGATLAQAQPMAGHEGAGPRHAMPQHMGMDKKGMSEGMGHGMAGGPLGSARMLDAVGASAEQKAKVQAIFKTARDEVAQQHEGAQALHQQMMQLLAAPQVDAAAAEGLRQKMLAGHDAVSKRLLQATLEASAVLTPEQRQKLSERMKARHDMRQRHRQEHHHSNAPRS